MALKQLLQNLLERVGLAEPPASPPQAVEMPLAEITQLTPIMSCLADWGVRGVRLIAVGPMDPDDLVQSAAPSSEVRHASLPPRSGEQPGTRRPIL